jgi:GntR family galactonate operon transcriptional repressor
VGVFSQRLDEKEPYFSRHQHLAATKHLDYANITCFASNMSEMIFYELKQISDFAPSLSTQVASEIGRRIVSAAYAPGGLIEDEASLARRYRVSRSIIRDAIKILVGKSLLEVRSGIGTRVKIRKQWALLDDDILAWQQAAPPNADIIMQLMDFRLIFEPKAARRAADYGSEEAHEQIRLALQQMVDEENLANDFVIADATFHRAVLNATNNEFLMALEGVIFSALLGSIRLTNKDPRDNESSIPLHREVYKAIKIRDGANAEKYMQELLEHANQRLRIRILDS